MKTLKTVYGRPRTSAYKAAVAAANQYYTDIETGTVYNDWGDPVGSTTEEPRITIHLEDRKYGLRIAKLVGLLTFGPEALRIGVSVRHKDGNKLNNAASNLELQYNQHARRTYARLRQKRAAARRAARTLSAAA